MATAGVEPSRIEPVRRRVAVAKAALAIGAAAAFGAAVALAKVHNAGHSKQPLSPLAPTSDYVAAVRKDVGGTGAIEPSVASPSAATHVS
ncbi:MAG: hypothetical protein ACRDL7_06865 [Gaiellaceae bacterium]